MTTATQKLQPELINGLLLCRYMQGREQISGNKSAWWTRGKKKKEDEGEKQWDQRLTGRPKCCVVERQQITGRHKKQGLIFNILKFNSVQCKNTKTSKTDKKGQTWRTHLNVWGSYYRITLFHHLNLESKYHLAITSEEIQQISVDKVMYLVLFYDLNMAEGRTGKTEKL